MSSVAEFLIERLENAGVRHVFGLPGDYILNFYDDLWKSPKIKVVNTTDEAHAGFAADAYARINGIGCVCVTYNVGALKLANAVACAYAERSPLIVISGSPGMKEREEDVLSHRMVRSFNCQHDIFKNITCASVVLDDRSTAGYHIDKALEALTYYKQPIYIELPRDVVDKPLVYDVYKQGTPTGAKSDPESLAEAIAEVKEWIEHAERPAILAGVEVARCSMGADLVKFAEKLNLPMATTLLSKSVVNERHPLFAGIYSGPSSREQTRRIIDDSDCLLMFGNMLTDISLNFRPAKFKKRQIINSSLDGLQIRNHTYTNVHFSDFCNTLFKIGFTKRSIPALEQRGDKQPFVPKADTMVTVKRMFEKIDSILDKNMVIVADIGDALFAAGDLTVHHSNLFFSPAYYTSMGTAIPGALGVQLAKPGVRPIVIVGDGAFQMSLSELSTIVEQKLNPIVFVLNNQGFSTERMLKEGEFNNIRNWDYHQICTLIRGGKGYEVRTEEALEDVVTKAIASKELSVINVVVDPKDISDAMRRMAEALAKRV